MPTPIAPPTATTPTMGAAAAKKPPIAVPTALAPEATALTPAATEEPAEAIVVPTAPSPTAETAFPIPDETEFNELDKALTALLLALVIAVPKVFAPTSVRADPDAIPTVAPTAPAIAL